MRVTQSRETNLNIFVNSTTAENILSVMKGMPFDCYNCQNITDVFMISCFIVIFDGHILTKNNTDIDVWECYLCGWSGKRTKCRRCRTHSECSKEIPSEGDIDIGPVYKEPVILLHADKRQREVEGLITLLPPMPVNDPFSLELQEWLKSTCLAWHKKALKWRETYEKWSNIQNQKYLFKRKPKTYSEIAKERWKGRNIKVKLPAPDFE